MPKKNLAHEEPTPVVAAPVVENPVAPIAPPVAALAEQVITEIPKPRAVFSKPVPVPEAEKVPVKTTKTMSGAIRKDY